MDLPNILNNKGSAAAAAAVEQLQQQFNADPHMNGHRAMSDAGSERGVSPHMSDPSSRFAARPASFSNLSMANAPQHRYTDTVSLPQQYSLMSNPYPTPTASIDGGYGPPRPNGEYQRTPNDLVSSQSEAAGQNKAFACSSCGKGFARRSDLARHGEQT